MHDCPHLSSCPVFAMFKNSGIANVWITLYCQGPQQESCVRRQLKEAGQSVPSTMLPNGEHILARGPTPRF